ncbi:MAG: Dethiobiotin synthetase [Crocinitomicaceae bacterium]|jgi:dethiobiotin synthetase|nr:Dethiobiotin synthetase [Crocinitomicaceae bacterium]
MKNGQSKQLFITGIGTNVGKTVVSAILCKASGASYWKPVQAGDLEYSDSDKVRDLSGIRTLAEAFRLQTPASPHLAARIDGIAIQTESLLIPETTGNLLIEGAGGLMVPLNDEGLLYIDVLEHWKIPAVLVSRHYLGSINHTLLSLEILQNRGIEVKALIFVGEENPATESAVLTRFPIKNVIRISEASVIDADFVSREAAKIHIDLFT